MATEVKLPELGQGIESGDVLEILVSEGDVISEGQDIVEMETDKATVPVPASAGGKVVKIHISSGDTVAIGGLLMEVEAAEGAGGDEGGGGGDASDSAAASSGDGASQAAPEEVEPAPQQEQQQPAAQQAPAQQAEQPRQPQPAQAPAAPQPTAPPQSTGPAQSTAAPQQPSAPASGPPPQPATPQPASTSAAQAPSDHVIPAGPAIRRFAREVGVDLTHVRGSGDGGRITREDVLEVVRQANRAAQSPGTAPSAPTQTAAPPQPTSPQQPASSAPAPSQTGGPSTQPGTSANDDYGPIRVDRMTKIRKTIANQMRNSWTSVPRVTNFDDADVTDLERLRNSSKEDYAAQGIKLTTMPFLIKAVATALKHNPTVNAVIDEENGQLIYKDYVNIGIAVDTDNGLVVPVMHNTDQMGIPDIARNLAQVAANVRSGQFGVNDLRGGTFTISNLGAIGGQYSTPIVNIPEVAILLVGRSRKLPVVMPDDSIQPRLMMPLSLSYDHRLVDGATAARFLNDVIGYLEAPSRLLLAL